MGGKKAYWSPGPSASFQVPMASERHRVRHRWSSPSEGRPRKRSCLRGPGDVAPSSRPPPGSTARPRAARGLARLKARDHDDVAWAPKPPRSSSRRRSSSSSSSSSPSSCSSGAGVDRAAPRGCLSRSARGCPASRGSPLHPTSPSLEEMASLEEVACSLKVSGHHALQSLEPIPRDLRGWGWSQSDQVLKTPGIFPALPQSERPPRTARS